MLFFVPRNKKEDENETESLQVLLTFLSLNYAKGGVNARQVAEENCNVWVIGI